MEHVLVIDAGHCKQLIQERGFVSAENINLEELLRPDNIWVLPRPVAEEEERFRQLIPYIIFEHDGMFAVYHRTKVGAEGRLHGKCSMGFGGHVNPIDFELSSEGVLDVAATLRETGRREIVEEVTVGEVLSRRTVGMLLDDADAVSRVHIGVVEIWRLASREIKPNDPSVMDIRFYTLDELRELSPRMETWSQRSLDWLLKSFSPEQAAVGSGPDLSGIDLELPS